MTDRVAVYIDFDNVVISRYDNIHGDGAWRKDEARHHRPDAASADPSTSSSPRPRSTSARSSTTPRRSAWSR